MADEYSTIAADEQHLRAEALDRLKRKRDFRNHLVVFLLVNVSLWVIWAVTGAGFPWPIFPLLAWGVGVGAHAFDTFTALFRGRRPGGDASPEARRLGVIRLGESLIHETS